MRNNDPEIFSIRWLLVGWVIFIFGVTILKLCGLLKWGSKLMIHIIKHLLSHLESIIFTGTLNG